MAEISRNRVGVATYLIPPGALHEPQRVADLREVFDACIADRELNLVLDLSGVGVVNSEALEAILDAQEQVSRLGGELRVASANATLRDVFRFTGLSTRIASIDGDKDEAEVVLPLTGDRLRIGEILIARGFATEEMVEDALAQQARGGRRMAEILVDKGCISESQLLSALGDQLGVPSVSLRAGAYDPEVAHLLDRDVARRLKVMALFRVRGVLYLATADPQSVPSIDAVEDLTGLQVQPVLASSEQIVATVEEAHSSVNDLAEFIGDLENDLELVENDDDEYDVLEQAQAGSPVVNLINGVIQRAIRDSASDIHIERSRTRCRIRLRVDGVLYTIMTPPVEVHPAVVSRLKVMANLDIAERRMPQDGRLQVVTAGRVVDLRFSSLPGIFGEKLVLRVLDKNQAILDIDRLGLSEDNHFRFKRLMSRSYGLLLVTGPTGSGKTTSLYAGLNHLNSSEKNIVTIEDPVEYQVEGINQNQVKENIGLGFAKILKHVLRQDPDIVMVGEIREKETAEIAVQAALTGHLVLSTLHTNDSVGAVTRLLDMGIEPFLLSSALIGVVAQRLVRSICPECATSYLAPASVLEQYGFEAGEKLKLTRGRGCSACYDSGYKGRIAIHEIVETSSDLQRLIVSHPSRDMLSAFLAEKNIKTLLHDGIERAKAGQTTLEEVFRVVSG